PVFSSSLSRCDAGGDKQFDGFFKSVLPYQRRRGAAVSGVNASAVRGLVSHVGKTGFDVAGWAGLAFGAFVVFLVRGRDNWLSVEQEIDKVAELVMAVLRNVKCHLRVATVFAVVRTRQSQKP